MPKSHLNADLLNNVPASEVAQASFSTLDSLQKFPPHIQLPGLCAMFLTMCEVFGENPQDIFTITKNIMADPIQGQRHEFGALRLYMENDL